MKVILTFHPLYYCRKKLGKLWKRENGVQYRFENSGKEKNP
jgi:tRNA(Ile)-lysidine synthase TilS/MesJ